MTLIFIQNYGCIVPALKLISCGQLHDIKIIIYGEYDVAEYFNKDKTLEIIKLPRLEENFIFRWFFWKKRYKKLLRMNNEIRDVWFFSIYYDYSLYKFLDFLNSDVNINYLDIFKIERKLNRRFSAKKMIFNILFSKNLVLTGDENVVTYYSDKIKSEFVDLIKEVEINSKHFFDLGMDKKSVLFLDGNDSTIVDEIEYYELTENLIKTLIKNGFKVFIKPHPTLKGLIVDKIKMDVELIAKKIPSELLKLDNCEMVIGLYSSALAQIKNKYPRLKVISLIECCATMSEPKKKLYREYLMNLNEKIDFKREINFIELERKHD